MKRKCPPQNLLMRCCLGFGAVVFIYFGIVLFSTAFMDMKVSGYFHSSRQEKTGPYLGEALPGELPTLFAPHLVSTGREHSSAMFTPDGNELWFGRIFPAEIVYMKKVNSVWTSPQLAPFSGKGFDLYPYLAPDGQKIFFTSARPLPNGEKPLGRGRGHIWFVEKTSAGWGKPRHLGSNINFGRLQGSPAVSALGTLFFCSRDPNNPTQSTELYFSRWENGAYTAPKNMGPVINSSAPDHSPYIAPDESYIIFSSFRGGYGRSDLFISFNKPDKGWTAPQNLGKTINSAAKDEYPYVTYDGKYFFFNSNRVSAINKKRIPDGPGNMYWMRAEFIAKLKSEALQH